MATNELAIRSVALNDDRTTLTFDIHIGGEIHPIYFRSKDTPLTANAEAMITPMLLPAMKTDSTIVTDGVVSRRFLESLTIAQDILQTWEPSFHRAVLEASSKTTQEVPTGGRVGCFFTCGVDSFYTLIKHREEITDLIFVHGYDIPLHKHELRAKTSAAIRKVAEAFGKNVIELETNLEPFLSQYSGWVHYNLGPALAAAGHTLAPAIRRIFIPASDTYDHLIPEGSHPLLDPLWGSDHLEFIHDGCEATRVKKVQMIAEHEVPMAHLRVCWVNPDQAYNCGRCEKCTRTMINLHVAGALHRCQTFNRPLTVRQVLRMDRKELTAFFYAENLAALEEANRPEDQALRDALSKFLKGKSRLARAKDWIALRLLEYPAVFGAVQSVFRKIQAFLRPKVMARY